MIFDYLAKAVEFAMEYKWYALGIAVVAVVLLVLIGSSDPTVVVK